MSRALCLAALLALGGCAALPMALSAGAGALTIAKDVLDIDVSLHQLTPGKTPISQIVPALPAPAADSHGRWVGEDPPAQRSGHDE
jgi:hypothetical protein